MNIIWTILMLASIVLLLFANPSALLPTAIEGVGNAIDSGIVLCGVYCFWGGIFGIMHDSGLTNSLSRLLHPIVRWLYGRLDSNTRQYIATNMSANLLGISSASTEPAIKAIALMEGDNTRLSRSGAMLFVINATSIQLLPTTVMGLRASMGSIVASDIVLPTLLATIVTTVLGVLMVNMAYGRAV